VLFSERSVVADRHIFAKLLREENKMDEMEYALYLSMYDSLDSLFRTPRIHKFLYLKVSPQRCLDRLRKRARHEESQVQLAYLHKIHLLHEEWLSKEPNVLVIDGEEEFEERPERANAML
jgi:deoxyadenosine/deoxycytidine kinase